MSRCGLYKDKKNPTRFPEVIAVFWLLGNLQAHKIDMLQNLNGIKQYTHIVFFSLNIIKMKLKVYLKCEVIDVFQFGK